jgi:hypothetical protein
MTQLLKLIWTQKQSNVRNANKKSLYLCLTEKRNQKMAEGQIVEFAKSFILEQKTSQIPGKK